MARKSRKNSMTQITTAPAERIWKVAVYVRLSLEDSGRKGSDTIETQIELVTAYVAQRTYLSLIDTYVDNGVSGKDFDRPAWNRLMDDIRAGKIDCICVKDLSRFSRNYIETCEFLDKIFPFMGVRFISVNDGYDNNTPNGKNEGLIVALKSLVHDQYLKDISRKVSSAYSARRERGEYTGSFAAFGYKKSKLIKGKLEPDETTAPIVRDIFHWRAGGMSLMDICMKLDALGVPCPSEWLRKTTNVKGDGYYKANIWQPDAIKRIITSPVYLGHLAYGKTRQSLAENKPLAFVPKSEWTIKKNTHEPIVSHELWEEANVVQATQYDKYYKNRKKNILPENIFRSYLSCSFCGSKLRRSHNQQINPSGKYYEYFYYYCPLKRKHPNETEYHMIRFETIYDLTLTLVVQKLQSAQNLRAIIEKQAKHQVDPRATLDAEIYRISCELEKINERISGLYESYVDKLLNETQYANIRMMYEKRAEAHKQRINDLSRKAAIVEDVSLSDNRWLKAIRDFQNPTKLTREMLEALVERIEVSNSSAVKIVWKFVDEFALLDTCANLQKDSVCNNTKGVV